MTDGIYPSNNSLKIYFFPANLPVPVITFSAPSGVPPDGILCSLLGYSLTRRLIAFPSAPYIVILGPIHRHSGLDLQKLKYELEFPESRGKDDDEIIGR